MRFILYLFLFLVVALDCLGQSFARYSSVLDRFDLDILQEDPKISFDKMGIIMYDGKYDPDLVLHYGLLCFERYKETNNYHYFLKVDEQCHYIFGGKSDQLYGPESGTAIRLTNDTLDVSAPRYSARVQGLALSLVLRYGTVETSVRIGKFANRLYQALIRSVEKQGCLARTNDGSLWLEEFPGSVVGRHSIKGMLVGIIGLIEYSRVKTDDLIINRLTDDLLNSLIKNIARYNDLTTFYGAVVWKDTATVNDQRELIFLFKHLYELTGNPIFQRQSALIAILLGHQSSEQVRNYDLFYSNLIAAKGELENDHIASNYVGVHGLPQEEFMISQSETLDEFPWFTYTVTKRIVIEKPSELILESDSEYKQFHMLYRYSWSPTLIETEPWNALNGKYSSKHKFGLAPGYYHFMTIHENKLGDKISVIKNSLKPIAN